MDITVGTGWATAYFVIGLIVLAVGIVWLIIALGNRESPAGGVILILFSFVIGYLWIYAATHFRVPINYKALLINTIDQTVIGEKTAGVHPRPFVGVKVINWPANTQYRLEVVMGSGVASATTKNGTSVYVNTSMYLDLSRMDVISAYKAYNGDWDHFVGSYLNPQMMGVTRTISQKYYTGEMTTLRVSWETDFEKSVQTLLATTGKGYGITLVQLQTIMSWDFVLDEDAKAFDNANRASYLVTQRENEKAALKIESEMVEIRSQMMSKTADATVDGMRKLADYIKAQPENLRPYLIEYLQTQVDLEYLRLVAQLQPDFFSPPRGQGMLPTYNVNSPQNVPVPTAATK